jgi:uncharacterized membrane protein (UPF0127 family)
VEPGLGDDDGVRRAVLIVLLVVLVACVADSSPDRATVTFEGATSRALLDVRVANTPDERARGLMGVRELADDEGMAFVWDEPTTGAFWMKDTLIPLAIAFVDVEGRIVTIREMTPCVDDPCPTYSADAPYVMAIEANADWYGTHGIEVGDTALLSAGEG